MKAQEGALLTSACKQPASRPSQFIPQEISQHPTKPGRQPEALFTLCTKDCSLIRPRIQQFLHGQAHSPFNIPDHQLGYPDSTLHARNRSCSSHSIQKFLMSCTPAHNCKTYSCQKVRLFRLLPPPPISMGT